MRNVVKTDNTKTDKVITKKAAPDYEEIYQGRFDKHYDELKWLYMELYDNSSMFEELMPEKPSRIGTNRMTCWE